MVVSGEDEERVLVACVDADVDGGDVRAAAALEAFAEYEEHSTSPADTACDRSVALQALSKHGPTTAADKPHWQGTSVGAQPAAEIAESRHDVYAILSSQY